MVKKVVMPAAGQTTDEATVTKLLVKVGDSVKKGDVLLEVETDKTVLPIESFAKGLVTEIFVKEFDKVDAGTALLAIGDEKDLEAAKSGAAAPAPAAAPAAPAAASAEDDEDDFAPIIPGQAPVAAPAPAAAPAAPVAKASGDYKAMPNAKKLASELGVDLSTVAPANGEFIKAADVKLAAENKPAAAEASAPEADYVDEKLPNIRKVIAKAMHTSLSTMAVRNHREHAIAHFLLEAVHHREHDDQRHHAHSDRRHAHHGNKGDEAVFLARFLTLTGVSPTDTEFKRPGHSNQYLNKNLTNSWIVSCSPNPCKKSAEITPSALGSFSR